MHFSSFTATNLIKLNLFNQISGNQRWRGCGDGPGGGSEPHEVRWRCLWTESWQWHLVPLHPLFILALPLRGGTFVRLSLTLSPGWSLSWSQSASQPVSLCGTLSRAFSRRLSGLAFELIATVGRAVIKSK